jgi:hypothetical protein
LFLAIPAAAALAAPEVQAQAIAGRVGARAIQARQFRGNNGANRGAMNQQRQNNHQIVSEIRGTMLILTQADHDYNGHRVRAIHQLQLAAHSMNPNRGGGGGAGNAGGAAGNRGAGRGNGGGARGAARTGANKMPQAQSDQHLQQALQRLGTIENQLANVGTNQGHATAMQHVRMAMGELRTALNIR